MKWVNRSIRLLGVVLLLIILIKTDLSKVWDHISRVNLLYLLYVYLVSFAVIFCRAVRWKSLLESAKIKLSLYYCFMYYYIGVFLRAFTPGSIGDFIKVFYLTQRKEEFGKSFSTCVVDRLADFIALVLLGILGLFFVDEFGLAVPKWTILAVIVVGIVIFAGLVKQKKILGSILLVLYKKLVPGRFKEKIKMTYTGFIGHIKSLTPRLMIIALFWTTLSWLVYVYQMHFLAGILGIPISFFHIVIVMSYTNFVLLIPVTIAGIGTRDATLIALFGLLGFGWEQALSFSLLVFSTNLFAGIVGSLMWSVYPVKVFPEKTK